MNAPAPKPRADWEAIERDYRAGVLSTREIARRSDLTEAAIRKRARLNDWERSLVVKKSEPVCIPQLDGMTTAGFVYVIYLDSGTERFYKIGLAKRFDARFDQHQCSSPFPICLALAYFVGDMRSEERALHAEYADQRVRGEWFRLGHDDLQNIAKRALLVSHE